MIVAPTGEIVAKGTTEEDEVISYDCDLALGEYIRNTTFNFAKHRRPEHYKLITERVVGMVQDGEVISVNGKRMKMRTDTVCIHGDTPGAVDIARVLRKGLADARIAVAPFKRAT